MVQVDLPAAFFLGQLYAIFCRKYLRKEPNKFTNKVLGVFNFFMSCGFVPGGMFLLVGWPAWEVMYQTSWVEKPFDRPWVAGFYVFFAVIMVVIGNVGFILGHYWYRIGKDKWVIYGTIIGFGLTILPFILKWGIWMNIGDFDSVVNNEAGYSFFKSPFFCGLICIMSYLFMAAIAMAVWLIRKGNNLEP